MLRQVLGNNVDYVINGNNIHDVTLFLIVFKMQIKILSACIKISEDMFKKTYSSGNIYISIHYITF